MRLSGRMRTISTLILTLWKYCRILHNMASLSPRETDSPCAQHGFSWIPTCRLSPSPHLFRKDIQLSCFEINNFYQKWRKCHTYKFYNSHLLRFELYPKEENTQYQHFFFIYVLTDKVNTDLFTETGFVILTGWQLLSRTGGHTTCELIAVKEVSLLWTQVYCSHLFSSGDQVSPGWRAVQWMHRHTRTQGGIHTDIKTLIYFKLSNFNMWSHSKQRWCNLPSTVSWYHWH